MPRRRAGRGRAVSSSHASCPMAQSDICPAGPIPPLDMCPAGPEPSRGASPADPEPPRGASSADPLPPSRLCDASYLRPMERCEDEEMENLSEPASAQAPQQPDVESLATTLEESSIQVSQPWWEMIPKYPKSFLEKYDAGHARKYSHNKYDAGHAHKCEEQQPVRGTAYQGTIEVSPESGRCLFSSSIRLREERNWGLTFYIRVDLLGSYHTYPCVGGPFQSLEEANDAIDCYLKDHQDPTMCLEPDEIPMVGEANVDYQVRRSIFWPDGTRKRRLISEPVDERRCWMDQLVKALVNKYNEDYNLVEGDAYEYKALVLYKIIWEGDDSHYHINFTAKTKEAHDSDPGHLFFAEVTHIPGEQENMVVTCISIINPSDKGRCYGCEIGMKHPSTAVYFGGHLDVGDGPCFPVAGPYKEWKGTDEEAKAEEAYLRHLFRPADPSVLDQLMEMEPYVNEDGLWILPDNVMKLAY